MVRQPFSFGCPACFEWPNGERVANIKSNRRLFNRGIPVRLWLPSWQFQKVERVCRFERADRSTAGVGSKILGLFGKAVEAD